MRSGEKTLNAFLHELKAISKKKKKNMVYILRGLLKALK
jgi:hypothetical protein